jgi:arabinogalactan endo-1,4-beta-galactosidase
MALRRTAALAAMVLALAPASAAANTTSASTGVPNFFVGVNVDGPAVSQQVDLAGQMDTMVSSGVESVRLVFNWSDLQPFESWSQIPASKASQFTDAGGIPTDYQGTDYEVALAAQRGLSVMPVVLYSPGWDTTDAHAQTAPPKDDSFYGRLMTDLVNRYGPSGTFWFQNPTIPYDPIHLWQVWNEPNLPYMWPSQPSVQDYAKLLRVAHDAIKYADPSATVVLAGTPDFSWRYLSSIYAIKGAKKWFDAVATHPYTAHPQGVITFMTYVRRVMNANGDKRKPLFATELGFPSSLGKAPGYGFETTEQGQATSTAQLMQLLAGNRKRLGLAGFYFYTWMGDEYAGAPTFNYAGLFKDTGGQIVAKPVFTTFTQTALNLEGCVSKGPTAGICNR